MPDTASKATLLSVESSARKILRDTYHLVLPEAPGADARDKLELFDLPAAAWEHVGRLTGIPEIEAVAGDLPGDRCERDTSTTPPWPKI